MTQAYSNQTYIIEIESQTAGIVARDERSFLRILRSMASKAVNFAPRAPQSKRLAHCCNSAVT